MLTEKFVTSLLRYRSRGGKQWKLALDHGISPSQLSATITGARPCDYDTRIIAIGIALGLNPDEVFVEHEESVAS